MDSTTLTHVAAILVGVGLTLVLVGFGSKKSETFVPGISGSTPAGSNIAASKKKKKKKGKTKDNGSSTSESNTGQQKQPARTGVKAKEEVGTPAPSGGGNNNSSITKKKTMKKPDVKKAGVSAASNGNVSNKENDAPKGFVEQSEEYMWQPTTSTKPQEDEWVVEGPKKKKNKNQPPKKAPSAAAPAASVPAATVSDTIMVDAKKIGIIIGPKGATMQAIQAATGCQLDINAPPKDEVKATKAGVNITGPDQEAISKARKAVTELATKGYATLLQSENFGEFNISVHPRYLSEIVGPNGRTIQAIQKTLDVKITIPSTDWKPNAVQVGQVKPAVVGIAGSKENSKTAKAVIQSLMKYHHHEITHPGMIHEEVYVPSEFLHCVIGPRGSEIKHIRGNYKVDVYMPGNDDSTQENVLVVGKQTNVDKAISYIQLLMDRDSEKRERKYNDDYFD